MSLENISTIEALLGGGPGAWAEVADHGAFVVCQSVTVLVVLAREAFLMVLASHNRALFRSFGLMRQHMGFEIFEEATAVGIRASAPFSTVIFKPNAR